MHAERITADALAECPGVGPDCAAALFSEDEYRLLWCNPQYTSMLDEPFRESGGVGRPLCEISVVGYATKRDALERAATSGECEWGEDRIFSVARGTQVYRWAIHRPQPGVLLALIDLNPLPPSALSFSASY